MLFKEIKTDSDRLRPENSEVERLFGTNKEFVRLTGWNPLFPGKDGFEKGLKKTIEWYKLNNKVVKRIIQYEYFGYQNRLFCEAKNNSRDRNKS